MKILITGSNGLLGQKIVKRCINHQFPFLATSKGENRNPDCPDELYESLDITNEQKVTDFILHFKPTAIIHTAAITNVDYCESNAAECQLVNLFATQSIWNAAKKVNAHFLLLSTDFVFDGEQGNYSETDTVHPLSVYAQSKVDAENLLIHDSNPNWSIARTIIVYGTGRNLSRTNLVLWAMEALPNGEEMKLVNDQFRAPTWADDLAYGCVEIIKRHQTGIFHLSGPTCLAIDEIVKQIAQFIGSSTEKIVSISSDTLNQSAKRPPRTGFDLTKAKERLDYNPKSLLETLEELRKELSK